MIETDTIEHVEYRLECNGCGKELMLAFDIDNEKDRKDFRYFENFIRHNELDHNMLGTIMDHMPEDCKNLKWITSCFKVIDMYKMIEKGEVKVCCDGQISISFNEKGQKELEIEDFIKKSGITHGLHEAFESIRPEECDDIIWILTCSRLLGLNKESDIM